MVFGCTGDGPALRRRDSSGFSGFPRGGHASTKRARVPVTWTPDRGPGNRMRSLPFAIRLEVRAVLGEGEVPAAAAGSGEEEAGAPIYLTAQTALDLSDAIREAVLLEIPIKNLCAEDCRGLCLECGANLNVGSCDCRRTPQDQRWSALRELSFPSDDQE
jgi:hypothetical protein